MITKKTDDGYKTPIDGIHFKTLCYGDKSLMAEFRLEKDNVLPEHTHPHEQTGYLVSGRINLIIDGVKNEIYPGDSWNIGGDVPHSAEVIEDSVAIEVFSPVREDYLP
mgnify:CR=1 FL=1